MSLRTLLLVGLMCFPSFNQPGVAQDRVLLGHSTKCDECSVSLREVNRFSSDVVLGEPHATLRLTDGSLVTSFYTSGPELHLISPSGESRVLLGGGDGPAEVLEVSALTALDGDSFMVWDAQRLRAFTFSLSEGVSDAFRINAAARDAARVSPSKFIVNMAIPSTHLLGLALHRVNSEGVLEKSFGALEGGLYRPDMPNLQMRRFTWTGSRLWSAIPSVYELEEWTSEGTLVRTWVREVPWFEGYLHRRALNQADEYLPWVSDVAWLGDDLIGVIVHTGKPNWRDFLGPGMPYEGGISYPQMDVPGMAISRIEVFDSRDGSLVASTEIPTHLTRFLDGRHLIEYTTSSIGEPSLIVHELVVEGW